MEKFKSKMTRHQHRIIALQLLYSLDIKNQLDERKVTTEISKLQENQDASEIGDDDLYYQEIIRGVICKLEELDGMITEAAIDWELERISPVARNIMRIALWEIKQEIPAGVAIDEAVELAREFDSQKTSAFINGILGKTIRS